MDKYPFVSCDACGANLHQVIHVLDALLMSTGETPDSHTKSVTFFTQLYTNHYCCEPGIMPKSVRAIKYVTSWLIPNKHCYCWTIGLRRSGLD